MKNIKDNKRTSFKKKIEASVNFFKLIVKKAKNAEETIRKELTVVWRYYLYDNFQAYKHE